MRTVLVTPALLVLCLLTASPASAEGLAFGPHAVGFRVACDPTGQLAPAEERILVWYPAVPSAAPLMPFAEYLAPSTANACGDAAVPADERAVALEQFGAWLAPMAGPGAPPFGGPMFPGETAASLAVRLANAQTRAVAGAAPAAGRFPLVLFHPAGALEQSTLLESLASQGNVVVTFPHRGMPPEVARRATPQSSPERISSMTGDIGRALDLAAALPYADSSRIVMMATGAAVPAALWFELATGRLTGIITYGGRYPRGQGFPERRYPSDDLPDDFVSRLTMPILDLTAAGSGASRGVLDVLVRAERIRVSLDVAHPGADGLRRLPYPGDATAAAANDVLARVVQQFVRYVTHGDAAASAFFDQPTIATSGPPGATIARLR